MTGWMPSASYVPALAGRLRSLAVGAAVVCGAVAPAVLPGAVAAADEPAGTTVVGELVQAWAEAAPDEAAAGHAHEGPMSWVQPAQGDPVLVDTAGVEGIPPGSTVAVTVENEAPTGSEDGSKDEDEAPRTVLDTELLEKEVPAGTTTPVPGQVTNQVTVAMVAPAGSDPKGDGTTLGQVVSVLTDRVAPFWSEQSGGAITLGIASTHDWAPATVDCSKPGLLWDEVAARVEFEPGPGKHLLVYVGRAAGCEYALAEVGTAPSSGGRLYVSDTSATAMSHEFGHNFGLGHSSAHQCDGTVEGTVEGGSCRTVAYRDYYDVMGVSWSQTGTLNAAQAELLGVLPEAQQQTLSVWGSATTTTLAPLSGRAGTRALRLTDADGVDYWLEYRTATDRDSWLAAPANRFGLESGVLLRRAGGLPDTSVLLDGTPTAAAGWSGDYRAALPVGAAVPVSGGDFSVVVQGLTPDGAVVSVTPTPPAAAGVPAPAAPRAPRGTVMPAADAATADAPVEVVSNTAALVVPERAAARRTTPDLASATGTTAPTGLLVAAAGTLLAATTLLVVRRFRAAARR
jgi:hypothetical protein